MKFEEVIKLQRRLVKVQTKFVNWFVDQEVSAIVDFNSKITVKYDMPEDSKHARVSNINAKYYKAKESRYDQTIYRQVEYAENKNLKKHR